MWSVLLFASLGQCYIDHDPHSGRNLAEVGPQPPQALRSVVWKNPLNLAADSGSRTKAQGGDLLEQWVNETYATQGFGSLRVLGLDGAEGMTVGGVVVRLHPLLWGEFEAMVRGLNVGQGTYSLGLSLVPIRFRTWSRNVSMGITGGLANFTTFQVVDPLASANLELWGIYGGWFVSYQYSSRLVFFLQSKVSQPLGTYHLVSFSAEI